MTNPAYAHFTLLADRSSSMNDPTDPGRTKAMDVMAGIKRFTAEQAAQPGRATFSLAEFWGEPGLRYSAPVYWGAERAVQRQSALRLNRVASFARADDPALAGWSLRPYGNTPLLDAMGTLITETGQALAAMPEHERPGRVFFVVGTDGEENWSVLHTKEGVAQLVAVQRDVYNWDFVFIGCDFDAFAEAGGMGIGAASTLSTNSMSSATLAAAYSGTSDAVTRARAGGQSVSYTSAERAAAAGEDSEKTWQGE